MLRETSQRRIYINSIRIKLLKMQPYLQWELSQGGSVEMWEKRLWGSAGSLQEWLPCSLSWLWDGFTAGSRYQNVSTCLFDTCCLLCLSHTLIKEHHFPFSFHWGKELSPLASRSASGSPLQIQRWPAHCSSQWSGLMGSIAKHGWGSAGRWAPFSGERNLISLPPAVRLGRMALRLQTWSTR